jgi:hypothetical protein
MKKQINLYIKKLLKMERKKLAGQVKRYIVKKGASDVSSGAYTKDVEM